MTSESGTRIPGAGVRHVPGLSRFEYDGASGETALLCYRRFEKFVDFNHTHVPEALRGQGIAALLTRAALDEARRLEWKIVPSCSYVSVFIDRNPEFADLLHQP